MELRGSLGAILLVAALTFIVLKQRDTAFIGVGAGYEGYTKYVKPAAKPVSRFKPSTTYRPIRGQQTKQGSKVQQQHRRVVKKYTVAQTKLMAELKQLKTQQQMRQYIANKANRVIALVNAARRLRGQPLLVRKPGLRPVVGYGASTGQLSIGAQMGFEDIPTAVAGRLGSAINSGDPNIMQKTVNDAITEAIRNNVTTGVPSRGGQLVGEEEELAQS